MSHPIIEGDLLICNQGTKQTPIKVNSQSFVYIDEKLQATEEDKQAEKNIIPFGVCKLKPSPSGYLPCSPALIKWQSTSPFDIDEKKELTTESFCKCSVGGTVTPLPATKSKFETITKADPQNNTNSNISTLEDADKDIGKTGYIIIFSGEIYQGGRRRIYKYSKGEIYEEMEEYSRDNQKFKTEPYTGNINEAVQTAKKDLDLLASNSEGKKLLDFFEEKRKVYIGVLSTNAADKRKQEGLSSDYADGYNITYRGVSIALPVENSLMPQPMPTYIILGHEMGHVTSYYLKKQDLRFWKNKIMIDEIYATHVENKLRRAAGIPLRDYYEVDKVGSNTRMLGEKHYSLYINKNEDYPSNPPVELNSNQAFDYDTIQKDK